MKLTKKRAKAISLEVWEYLRDHPEVDRKDGLPKNIYKKIKHVKNTFPLCELSYNGNFKCPECPVLPCYVFSAYYRWFHSDKDDRAKYAGIIVEKIKAWEV